MTLHNSEIINTACGRGDAKSLIRTAMINAWQKEWDSDTNDKHYYKIQESVNIRQLNEAYRREELIFTRLRFGHGGVRSVPYLMGKSNTNLCQWEHIIMQCCKYNSERETLEVIVHEAGQKWSLNTFLGINRTG